MHLLFDNVGLDRMIPIGKYPLLNGQSFFIALTRANRSEKLQRIITFPLKQYAVFFGQLVKQSKRGKCYLYSTRSTNILINTHIDNG